ncbi:TonB-dependent receptor plug domain-containing protein [Novosphingobium naphthalenivorans]|uniref:TonB-dependent receptor plug domain-containing protein n=1 Tax=Novosphingobium naphthalenivorans TaxID=273168 RepID=UPI000AF35192|nr:TonB-dependent receptor [Novosphingobium naphthalenivorans]
MFDRTRINKMFVSRLTMGVALGAAASVYGAPAWAQDTQASAVDKVDEDNIVIVTGSRVARQGFESPTPLTVMSQQDILNQSPTNNLADFVNQLPALAGSTMPSNSRLALSSGLAGINALNLRNMGEIRTLVLLDGRRSVGSSVTGLVDINTFPQQLVKSVEVVTGGASAAYGSDAVAGVVNFVLDKKYEGLKLSADTGITQYGDGFNYSFKGAGGFSFADGRGHVLLSGEYAHKDGIFKTTRKWNAHGDRIIPNPDYTADNGLPRYIRVSPGGTNNVLPGGIINSSTGTVANSLRGIYFGEGGSVNQYDYGSLSTSSVSVGGDWALADNGRNIGLDAQDDRRGLYGRVSYDATDWATVWAEASYTWTRSLFNAGPQYASSRTLTSDNAYLINALGADALAGVTSVKLGTTSSDLPYRETNNQRDVQRYALGAEGEFTMFGKPAIWSAYGQYGETNTREQLRNIMNNEAISLATDAVFDGSGNIVCRSTLTDAGNGCVPINWLGTGVMTQEMADYVLGDPYRKQKLKQTVAGINLSVTPFATWAGDVSVAVGGEYRKEEISGYVPEEYQTGWSVGNYLPTFGSYNVKEAYLETVVPLGLGLEFNGAVRATDYSTSGYVTTWKTGATWQPIPDFRLRVTQSRDIRAPNLAELYAAGTSRTNSLTDPITGAVYTFLETTTGNPNLKPEKADSTVIGGVFTPTFLPGLSFSADWFQIKLKDAISQYYSQDIYNRCIEGHTAFCSAFTADPSGQRDYLFSASPFNFSRITTRGIDFDLAYRRPVGDGSVTLRALATHYIDRIVDDGISTPIDTAGTNGGSGPPNWIFRFSATYDTPSFSLTGTARGISSGRYSSSYYECTSNCPASTTEVSTIDNNHVSGTFYVDANATFKIGDTMFGDSQFFINVTNLFNASPLLLPESGMAANTTYSDLLGRSFRVGFRFEMK